jgi:hypothetical protein
MARKANGIPGVLNETATLAHDTSPRSDMQPLNYTGFSLELPPTEAHWFDVGLDWI